MSKHNTKVLIVDDEPDIRQLVYEILKDEGYQVAMAENAQVARELKQSDQPDLILLDIWMPDTDGITLLKEWVSDGVLNVPIIMMSGHGTIETAVEATRLGAYDFLEKPLSLAKLLLVVERGLEASLLKSENAGLKLQLNRLVDPVGSGANIEQLKDQLKRLAQHDARVLFSGEGGAGKELFARYLHNASPRRSGPFVDVSVGSIASENAATEFFGTEESGKIYPGLLERAHGGVLFLGEVADMDLETQLRLVSAMDSSSFLRVGGSTPVSVDVRVIASTRVSLEAEVRAGQFRQDLFYLLNVVSFDIPPLREHSEDIPLLLSFYIDFFVKEEKLSYRKFSIAAQNFLRNYAWPGNVRELKNVVQRLLILGVGEEIDVDEVKKALGSAVSEVSEVSAMPEFFNLSLKEAREQFEKSYIQYHFECTGGSVAKLSAVIGMERTHLYRKLHALKIKL